MIKRPIKVLQFGSGNFLRGFADWMIDIMNEKECFNGGIEIVQSLSSSRDSHLSRQEGLYHVVTKGLSDGSTVQQIRLISSVVGAFNAHEEIERFYRASINSDLEFIVSNTTEAGIKFVEEPWQEGTVPLTFPGKLTVVLYQRFRAGLPGIIMLPCELIENNGRALLEVVIQYAKYWGLPPDFENWVIGENIFCNTLVDRIVPGCSELLKEEVEKSTDFQDEIPVMVEPYHLWAIEAPEKVKRKFPADQCGLNVHFVEDLSIYRSRKVRILNGGHTAVMAVGYLRGLHTIKACILDQEVKSFLEAVIYNEIIPTVLGDKNEAVNFADEVLQRFANPFIEHRLASIALNSIAKFRVRVLPCIIDYYKVRGVLPKNLVHAFAAMIVFYRGHWRGEITARNDEKFVMEFFDQAWRSGVPDVVSLVLSNESFWGRNLNELPGLAEALESELALVLASERGSIVTCL